MYWGWSETVMTDRIIEIGDSVARASLSNRQLLLKLLSGETVSIALRDLAAVILSGRHLTLSRALMAALSSAGVAVILVGEKGLPVGQILPLEQHSTQATRFRAQADLSRPRAKRIWQTLVRAKIDQQAALLEQLHADDAGLRELARQVRSGDPDNREAVAARRYWNRLFGDTSFRRRRDADDQNRLLNYGYAVLRAAVARAICAVGLHPGLGVHHHHRSDAFCLADDLIEPYRPLVDAEVVEIAGEYGNDVAIDRPVKTRLLGVLTERWLSDGEDRAILDLIARSARSLAATLLDREQIFQLSLPDLQKSWARSHR